MCMNKEKHKHPAWIIMNKNSEEILDHYKGLLWDTERVFVFQ